MAFYDPRARRTYCDDCNPNAGEHNGNWRSGQETTVCRSCGGEFEYYPSEKKGVYCPACVTESDEFLGTPYRVEVDRVETECGYCGEPSVVPKSEFEEGRGKYCDLRCFGSWSSENVVGEDHHKWEGGSINYGHGWWSIRRLALEWDDHTCQACGADRDELGREPDVHHIVPVRTFDDPRDSHTLDNVVCLCRSCHRLVEDGWLELPS